jgi:protein-tyrosine phosphatase
MPPSVSSAPPTVLANPAGYGQAAEALAAGKLVVLPTETVYGIAVNLHSSTARVAARSLKARLAGTSEPSVAPWVIHVPTPDALLTWTPSISPIAKRLILKSLPGPVAFQIKLDEPSLAAPRERLQTAADETLTDGYIHLRCPDFAASQAVLDLVSFPVAIIGAGTPAQPGIFEASDLPGALFDAPDGPALILDAGSTRYRRSSTVVRIEGDQISVVRPGVIDERIIQRLSDFTILFLCSGNTCRSPMAAAIAAKQLADKFHIAPAELPLRHIVVQSAGLHAAFGMRAAMEAMDAVKTFGADLTTHISQPTSPELLRRADVIYTMTDAHRDEVLELVPGAARKTFLLDPNGDIADPIGSSLAVYQQVAARMSELLRQRLGELSV